MIVLPALKDICVLKGPVCPWNVPQGRIPLEVKPLALSLLRAIMSQREDQLLKSCVVLVYILVVALPFALHVIWDTGVLLDQGNQHRQQRRVLSVGFVIHLAFIPFVPLVLTELLKQVLGAPT